MGFHDLVAALDDLLKKYGKGKTLKPEKLEALEQALEKKRAKYRERLDSDASEERRDQIELRLQVVEAQLAKLRELKE
jgi:hypothetical protein